VADARLTLAQLIARLRNREWGNRETGIGMREVKGI
jgi:hypothetical protein